MDWIDLNRSLQFIENELKALDTYYGMTEREFFNHLDKDTYNHVVSFYKKKKIDFLSESADINTLLSPTMCDCHKEEWFPLFDDHLIVSASNCPIDWTKKKRSLNGFIHADVGKPQNAYELATVYGKDEMMSSIHMKNIFKKIRKESVISLESYKNFRNSLNPI